MERTVDATRFDTITRLFARRKSRRTTFGSALGGVAPAVTAQEATPEPASAALEDPHPDAGDAQVKTEFLFVQPFAGGTWLPSGEAGTYTLSLCGAAAQTVYFSDRPERVFGQASTQEFLDGLGFTPENPPNAALVAQDSTGEQDVVVIELFDPQYDITTATLTYQARVLADYTEAGPAHGSRPQQDSEMKEDLGPGSLFIDDCPNLSAYCYQEVNGSREFIGTLSIGQCTHVGSIRLCSPCDDLRSSVYGKQCAAHYPDQCSYGQQVINGRSMTSWDCFADFPDTAMD